MATPIIGTVDATTSFNTSSFSGPVTVDAGADLAIVAIAERFTDQVTAATLGGVTMTQLVSTTPQSVAGVAIWYLEDPPTGTPTLALTLGTSRRAVVAVISVSGTVSGDLFRSQGALNYVVASGNPGGNPSVAVTSQSNDLVMDVLAINSDTDVTVTASAGQTQDYNFRKFSGSNGIRGAGSHKTATGSSSTMGWTRSASTQWTQVGIALKAPAIPFPSLGVIDSGIRANQGPPPSYLWANDPVGTFAIAGNGLRILNNQITGVNDQVCADHLVRNTYGPATEVYADLFGATGATHDLFWRYNPTTKSGYVLLVHLDEDIAVARCDNGTVTTLDTVVTVGAPTDGDQVGIRMNSSTIEVYVNQTLLFTRTDSTYTGSGTLGYLVHEESGLGGATNFGGGTIGEVTPINLAGSLALTGVGI